MRCAHWSVLLRSYIDNIPIRVRWEQYYMAQRELRIKLSTRRAPAPAVPPHHAEPDPRWLITDLITLGSPLTHAEFLPAADKQDLRNRVIARELPESPPFREDLDPKVLARAQATKKLPLASPPEKSTAARAEWFASRDAEMVREARRLRQSVDGDLPDWVVARGRASPP